MSEKIRHGDGLFVQVLKKRTDSLFRQSIDGLVRELVASGYPKGSFLASFPSEEEKARAEEKALGMAEESGYEIFFEKNPGLRVRYDTLVRNCGEFEKEVFSNIEKNREKIEKSFFGGRTIGSITGISVGDADCHNSGRQTLTVETDAGKFLYKPHTLRPDNVLGRICLGWFSDVVYIPKAVDCGDFGFAEFVDLHPADSKDSAKRFFWRLGGVGAIATAIGITDLHFSNVLARGDMPVLVDLETALSPSLPVKYTGGKDIEALNEILESIVKTNIIGFAPGGAPIGAINSIWEGTMHPVIDGEMCNFYDYSDCIVSGFEEIYERCMSLKDKLSEALDDIRETKIRTVLRPTKYYVKLLDVYRTPVPNTNIDVRGNLLKVARTVWDVEGFDKIAESEMTDLENGDVPYFFAVPDGKGLYDSRGLVLDRFFRDTMMEKAKKALDSLSEKSKTFNSRILRYYLDSAGRKNTSVPLEIETSEEPISEGAVRETVTWALEKICNEIIDTPKGHRLLLGMGYNTPAILPLDPDLAMGYSGIVLFAAASSAAFPETRHLGKEILDLCYEWMEMISATIPARGETGMNGHSFGFSRGIGGMLKSLVILGDHFGEKRARELYDSIVKKLEPMSFPKEISYSIYNGIAGLLLPLCEGRKTEGTETLIDKITDLLLEGERSVCGAGPVWVDREEKEARSGFGKGQCGIGYVLSKSFGITGDERCRSAVDRCIEYERLALEREMKRLEDGKRPSVLGICTGAPGIVMAMSELAESGYEGACEARDMALDIIGRVGCEYQDNLCCGNAAIAESLIVTGRLRKAGTLLEEMYERSKQNGSFAHSGRDSVPSFRESLMFGASGVCYEMLRYLDPDGIPSVFL